MAVSIANLPSHRRFALWQPDGSTQIRKRRAFRLLGHVAYLNRSHRLKLVKPEHRDEPREIVLAVEIDLDAAFLASPDDVDLGAELLSQSFLDGLDMRRVVEAMLPGGWNATGLPGGLDEFFDLANGQSLLDATLRHQPLFLFDRETEDDLGVAHRELSHRDPPLHVVGQ